MTPPLVIPMPAYVVVACAVPLLVGVLLAVSQPALLLVLVPIAATMALWMRSYLVADDEGLTFRTYGLRTRHLPWSDVAGLAFRSYGSQRAGTQVLRTDGGRHWLPWVDRYERATGRPRRSWPAPPRPAGTCRCTARRDGGPVR